MNPSEGLGRGLLEIAAMLGGIAFIAMLVANARGVSTIVESAGDTFSGLLGAATLQNGYRNVFS